MRNALYLAVMCPPSLFPPPRNRANGAAQGQPGLAEIEQIEQRIAAVG
jgi:hypothetical protein